MPKRKPGSDDGDEINLQFGARLRMFREAAGYSQTEIGDALGVSFQQIQKYENGKTSVSLSRLNTLASFLRLPIIKMLDGLELPQVSEPFAGFAESEQAPFDHGAEPQTKPYTRQKAALLSAFGRIDSVKTRRTILALVEALGSMNDGDGEDNGQTSDDVSPIA